MEAGSGSRGSKPTNNPSDSNSDKNNNRSPSPSHLKNVGGEESSDRKVFSSTAPTVPATNPGRLLMSNLPYMGELTFDSRPRRGRKPKKADICHLISKNYGITFPAIDVSHPNNPLPHRTDKDVLVASSPLEFGQLSISHERPSIPTSTSHVSRGHGPKSSPTIILDNDDEPLNLCLRDRYYHKSSDSNLVKTPPPLVTSWLLQPSQDASIPQGGTHRKRKRRSTRRRAGDKVQNPTSSLILQQPSSLPPPPSSEVSICKFKFTGGAKPCLQEKKMFSVDAGGNFRFYSDKPTTSNAGTKSSSVNKKASPTSLSSTRLSHVNSLPIVQSPILPFCQTNLITSSASENHHHDPSCTSPGETSSSDDDDDGNCSSPPNLECESGGGKRKRRTRKSLVREKLERTFKEKGFLIQTQHLESAEGATYCKFRQLRKFTRYLFRSWKDYLPENVKEISSSGNTTGTIITSTNSPTPSNNGESLPSPTAPDEV